MMKFIDKYEKETPKLIQADYDKNGQLASGKVLVYAQQIVSPNGISFFIKTFSSAIFDPNGPLNKREKFLETKMKKVSQTTFGNYLKYLQTKNLKYLTLAQRGFLSDRA
jgi:hypothetical protein